MYIKQVVVRNLWQRGNIVWNLREDVNVLVGINGSGKSTILKLIFEALQPEISEEAKKRYFSLISELTIYFSDDSFVLVDSSGERFPLRLEHIAPELSMVSTFDIANSLDDLIAELQLKYEIYQKNLYKRFEEALRRGAKLPDGREVEEIFGRRRAFLETINRLFRDTGKSFSEDDFVFKLENQENKLTHRQLSSGEKQIFYILLQTLVQDGRPSILLMDEPEISLHIEWQRDLIYHIRQLNPNCQIIAVTHSANMYFGGWSEHKLNIEEIRHDRLNGQAQIDIESRLARFTQEFGRIMQEERNENRKLNEVNAMLHRTFPMLTSNECKSILKTMRDAGLSPDHYTYTTLISKTTNKEDALNLLRDMKERGIIPNAVTYVNVLKKTENLDEAISVFDLMREDRIEPAIQHFSTLLGKADSPQAAQRVEELRSLYGIPVNDIYANKLRVKK